MSQGSRQWQRLDTRLLQKTRVFDLYANRMRSPDGRYEDDFFFIKSVDWVNIIPITPENEIIFVRQFRHGIQEPCLEIPGGMLDATEPPVEAAKRELLEETGYSSNEVIALNYVHPNPAIQSNRCHFFVAKNCKITAAQNLDPAEDIEVELIPIDAVRTKILNCEITHSLVVSAFCHYFLRNP